MFDKKRLLPPIVILILIAGISACTSILSPGPAPMRLQLAPAMPGQISGKVLQKQLVVAMPLCGSDIDSDGIALVFNRREVRYLADARWTSPVPSLMQRALIDAVNATNRLSGVADESAGIMADAKLLCDVRQFSLHYADSDERPAAVITASFRLLNLSTGSIMGMRSVNVSVPAGGRDKISLVTACENALSRCLAEVAPWVIQTMSGGR